MIQLIQCPYVSVLNIKISPQIHTFTTPKLNKKPPGFSCCQIPPLPE